MIIDVDADDRVSVEISLGVITAQPTGPGDRPVDDIRIVTVEIDGP